jgi:TetR/AcrR family transcriptional regulator, transcriptional repressor for nem operon
MNSQARLMEIAEAHILAKGFTATSLGAIASEAGLSKAGLLHHFGSKDELGVAVLRYACTKRRKLFLCDPIHREVDPLEQLNAYLDFIIQFCHRPGATRTCILAIYTLELSHSHPEMVEACQEYLSDWSSNLIAYLDRVKAKYSPGASWKSQDVAEHFLALFEGSLIIAKAKRNPGIIDSNLNQFKQYLHLLLDQ